MVFFSKIADTSWILSKRKKDEAHLNQPERTRERPVEEPGEHEQKTREPDITRINVSVD